MTFFGLKMQYFEEIDKKIKELNFQQHVWVPTVKNNQTYQYNTVQCTVKKIIPIRDVG